MIVAISKNAIHEESNVDNVSLTNGRFQTLIEISDFNKMKSNNYGISEA